MASQDGREGWGGGGKGGGWSTAGKPAWIGCDAVLVLTILKGDDTPQCHNRWHILYPYSEKEGQSRKQRMPTFDALQTWGREPFFEYVVKSCNYLVSFFQDFK